MIVARGLGRGDAQVIVTGSLGGLGRRVAVAPNPFGGSGGKGAPGWARGGVSARVAARLPDDEDVLLLVLAAAVQVGLLE